MGSSAGVAAGRSRLNPDPERLDRVIVTVAADHRQENGVRALVIGVAEVEFKPVQIDGIG